MSNHDNTSNSVSKGMIIVVEDDENLRISIETLLITLGYQCLSFESAVLFLKYCKHNPDIQNQPGCILLDVRLPGMSGLELQGELALMGCILPIVFVTAHADVPMAVQALENGALGFLTKPYQQNDLLEKLNTALAVSCERVNNRNLSQNFSSLLKNLTQKENEILPLIVEGKTNKEIAANLFISDRTVEVHRARIFKKLQAISLNDLIARYTQFKLKHPD